MNVRFCRFVTG
jgi:hypothetical protein